MKKILSVLLVIALVLSLGTLTAFAEEKSTTVTYTVAEPTYTVTIPATAELDKEFNITAENVTNIPENQELIVRVTNWTTDTATEEMALINEADSNLVIPCVVKKGASGAAIALNGAVLSVSANGSAPLYITQKNPDSAYAPGTYKGTMTFTVAIENVGK